MDLGCLNISPILSKHTTAINEDCFAICWIKTEVDHIEINGIRYTDVTNSIFFLSPEHNWQIVRQETVSSSGYVLNLPKKILDQPTFSDLHINQVRLFNSKEIPKIHLSPGIEIRIQSILEMMDELISTHLNHREEALLALLKTFFIYCDGKCNIRSVISESNSKASLVYKFKKCIDQKISKLHEVSEYASELNISDKYLNECVKEVLGVNAKSLIDEQLTMRSRHALKFTDKSVKEISYEMGFTSPEYFSYYIKKHLGHSPSRVRST
ncbi:helix-turn-helix domain-containing protein [Gracilimonas amylolytica]|uniref:helix-turn-helix domain-containing protein n=1 Tax=Gracilimonas amylolytica TaxID=1749045 RepID=UPI000CD85871|nr:helix-turn-helix domain-containing protein [Gracilimonas amylolytica]